MKFFVFGLLLIVVVCVVLCDVWFILLLGVFGFVLCNIVVLLFVFYIVFCMNFDDLIWVVLIVWIVV